MAKKTKTRSPLAGRWRITWMDQWDQDFVDEETEGFFEFGPNDSWSFQFGYVQGTIDYRTGIRDAKPCVEFTWDGNDEMDAVQGRGWAILDGNEIKGMIFIHQGDESEFKAEKKQWPAYSLGLKHLDFICLRAQSGGFFQPRNNTKSTKKAKHDP